MPPLIESGAPSPAFSGAVAPHNDEIRRIIQSPLAFWGLGPAGRCGLRFGYKGLANDHKLSLQLFGHIHLFAEILRYNLPKTRR